MSVTTTQLLSSGEFCKLLYDTIPVKSASANVSFLPIFVVRETSVTGYPPAWCHAWRTESSTTLATSSTLKTNFSKKKKIK